LFFFLLFYNYSFAAAVQRRIGELKLALPCNVLNHSKWRRDEEDINKGFGHRWCSVIGKDTLVCWNLKMVTLLCEGVGGPVISYYLFIYIFWWTSWKWKFLLEKRMFNNCFPKFLIIFSLKIVKIPHPKQSRWANSQYAWKPNLKCYSHSIWAMDE